MLRLVERGILQVLLLVTLVSTCRAQQYTSPQQYKVQDEGDGNVVPAKHDYSSYLPGVPAKTQAAEEEGFVQPLDFSGLFGTPNIGVARLVSSPTTVQDFFRPANSEVNQFGLPLGSGTSIFPSEVELLPNQKNISGFTNPQVKFQSLFDVSGSASDVGFRPQDFLRSEKNTGEENQEDINSFSPSFSKITSDYTPSAVQGYPKVPDVSPNYGVTRQDKASYRASPSEDKTSYSNDDYNVKPNIKSRYPEEYSAKSSKYRPNKSYEVSQGKSSYPAPSRSTKSFTGPETYRPSPAEVHQDNRAHSIPQRESYEGKSSYVPSLESQLYPSKTGYRSSVIEPHLGKSSYPSPAPVDIYGAKPSHYAVSPQNKASYTPSSSDIYKQFGIAVPSASSISQAAPGSHPIYGGTTLPLNSHKSSAATNGVYSQAPTTIESYLAPNSEYRSLPSQNEEVYEKQSTDDESQTASAPINKDKKCKKVEKHVTSDDIVKGRFRRDAMSCYVCEDPKTKLSYEKCSYEAEPQGSNYFRGHTQSYKVNNANKPEGLRFRRDLEKIVFDFEKEFEKETEKIYPRTARQESGTSYGSPSNYGNIDNYKFGPEYFKGASVGEEEKYSSPSEYTSSSSTAPSSKHCKKVEKDSMTCYECKDPKTGGSYEQCSYSTAPKKNNYFKAHQSSFSSGDKKPRVERYRRGFTGEGSAGEILSRQTRQEPGSNFRIKGEKLNTPIKSEDRTNYKVPNKYSLTTPAASEKKETTKFAGHGLDPFLYGEPDFYNSKDEKSSEGSEKLESFYEPSQSYEDYFHRLFPELVEAEKEPASSSDSETYDKATSAEYTPAQTKEELKSSPNFEYKAEIPEFFTNNEQKKDLDKVLGEFSNKDRSNCKKVTRDKMTCYQCLDNKGIQHEECMFVAASEPKSQHLAYHEVKEFRLVPPSNENQTASASDLQATQPLDSASSSSTGSEKTACSPPALPSKALSNTITTTATVPSKPKRKTFFKKVTSTTTPLIDSKDDETKQVDTKRKKVKTTPGKAPAVSVRVTRKSSQSVFTTSTDIGTTLAPATTPSNPRKISRRKVTSLDMVGSASDQEERVENVPAKSKSSGSSLPSEPELSEHDRSPDGYYTAETRTRFDPVLKVTLPEYMLTWSEHEAIFDEVMASGRRR